MSKGILELQREKIQRKYIQKQLLSSRIDIKNNGTEQNRVKIIASNCKIETPSWFTNAQGVGQVVEYNNGIQKMTIKVIQDGRLRISILLMSSCRLEYHSTHFRHSVT